MTTSAREPVPAAARAVAKVAAAALGGTPRISRFYDADESTAVDLLTCADQPAPDYSSYSTVTLHQADNRLDGEPRRVELAGVAAQAKSEFPNLLATAAFYVAKDGWLAAPGVVFADLVGEYGLSQTLRHLLWTEPFPWAELSTVEISAELTVHWLLAVPISESERQFLLENGYFALEERLAAGDGVDYFDLDRAPVV